MKDLYKNSKEEQLIENLKTMEVTPPVGLWNDIDATLLAKERRRTFIITSWASAATIALLFSIGGMYYMNQHIKIIATVEKNSPKAHAQTSSNEHPENQIENILPNRTIKKKTESAGLMRKVNDTSQFELSAPFLADINNREEILRRIELLHPSLGKSEALVPERIFIKMESIGKGVSKAIAIVEPTNSKPKREWIYSASGFPVYAFHTAGAKNNSRNQYEAGIVSWGGSVSLRYVISKKISLETGIIYNILGQQEKNIYLVTSDANNLEVRNHSGFTNSYGVLTVPNRDIKVMGSEGLYTLSTDAINASSFIKVDALQRFRYLEIPVLLAKEFHFRGINLSFKAGLSSGFLVGNRLDISGANLQLKGRTNGVDPIVFSGLASLGVSIPIINQTRLLVEPTFRLGLKSLSTLNGKSYPFSTYFKIGIEIPV